MTTPIHKLQQAGSTSGDADADYASEGGIAGKYALYHKRSAGYIITTSQNISGIENGYYSLSAAVQNSGGQNACYISAKTSDEERMTSLPVSSLWNTLMIRGIHITDGKCTIKIF